MNRRLTTAETLVLLSVAVILLGLCLPFDTGLAWLSQSVGHLLVGWFWYLGRTLPKLSPNPSEFAVAGVALLVLTVGGHRLGRFLSGPGWRAKWTAQAVGLLVLLFACGTAAVGITHQTAWLVRSPEPLTQHHGRGALARAVAVNNLKQLGLAAHNFEGNKRRMPAPTYTDDGRPLHSWHTYLLPYIEEDALYSRLNFKRPWNDPANRSVVETRVKTFLRPEGDGLYPDGVAVTHFAPNARLFDQRRKLTDLPAGLSNTILAAEALNSPKPWADPLNWRDPRQPLGSRGGYGGVPGRPVLVLMADGSVRSVTPAGWEPVRRGLPPAEDD